MGVSRSVTCHGVLWTDLGEGGWGPVQDGGDLWGNRDAVVGDAVVGDAVGGDANAGDVILVAREAGHDVGDDGLSLHEDESPDDAEEWSTDEGKDDDVF